MSIKSLRPNANSTFKQGYFRPTHPEKYKGDPNKIIFRSSWEHKFMTWCDLHPNIKFWASEGFSIPYLNPCKGFANGVFTPGLSNYWVDFWVIVDKGQGEEKWIVEIKPKAQVPTQEQLSRLAAQVNEGNKTLKKVQRQNRELKTLLVNRAKFIAAKKFAEERGCKFAICTEHFLF
jgi:hypothetical protein